MEPRNGIDNRKRLVIVGNGPLPRDLSAEVDRADHVIRFNDPKEGVGLSGSRTDQLFMVNSGKAMQRLLDDPAFVQTPLFRAAHEIVLVYHPSIIARYLPGPNLLARLGGRRGDWTARAVAMFGKAGKEIRIMPPQFYRDACQALGVSGEGRNNAVPSTGYLGMWYALKRFPAERWRIEICGFTWAGWKRHAWGDERSWVEAQVEAGRLTMMHAGRPERIISPG